jgi:NTP pyrophosphatase (non-canonical NTP hydrolase)
MDLSEVQIEHTYWREKNFPHQVSYEALLGMVEEVGELCHAHLKGVQGIRHTPEEVEAMKRDALGDIFIFALSYCGSEKINLEECIEDAWDNVRRRDWQADPKLGGQ